MCRRLCLMICLILGLSLALPGVSQGADPDLVGWWWFDEGTGTVASDSSDYGNHGTLMGGAGWAPGYFRTALELDGVDGYVDVPHNDTLLAYGDVSVMAWINTPVWETPGQGYQGIIAKGNSVRSYSLYTTSSGVMHFSTGQPFIGSTSSATVPQNEWVHVCAMIADGGHAYFLNGEPAGTGGSGAAGPGDRDTENVVIGRTQEGTGRSFTGLIDDARIYVRGLTQAEIQAIMTGNDLATTLASAPNPEDGATDVPLDAAMTWLPGEYAATHDVYLGTVFEDVNNASRANPMDILVSESQAEASYDPEGLLEIGQTYYWRVDEVNAAPDNTIFKGTVWSFTAEPLAYPIEGVIATSNAVSEATAGIENTVNGSGLNADDQHSTDAPDMFLGVQGAEPIQIQYEFDRVYKLHEMLVWNYNVQFEPMLGFGIKDVTVEYSTDGAEWMVLGDVVLAQATARSDYVANTAIDFGGAAVKLMRMTVNSGYGPLGQFGLSEVRFMFIPAHAREPQPADGATGVEPNPVLDWRLGRDAVSHDVYLSTDEAAVADGTALVDNVAERGYAPDPLDFGSTYYWRIDEVQEAESWAGEIWSFATLEYAVIDDMESYDDEDNAIFDTWIDGFVNETGSTVGYFNAPFAETSIVNSGSQSMPLEYNNAAAPFYSEAERDLGSLDIDTNGANSLRLFVSGLAPGFNEAANGTILMNAIGADIWGTADECRYAYKQLTGDGSMVARVDALDGSPSTWAKAGVMIRQNDAVGAVHSFMCMTGGDGNGASWQGRPDENAASVNNDATSAVAPPYWVRIDRSGDTLTGFISEDGQNWIQNGDARSIAMTDPVLIGLALTSHNAAQATSAEFSNVSFTGSVSGDWQIADIGVAQPEGNDPEALYVALEDTSGNVAVVTHPDPSITARSGWSEWVIPYTDLAGVNLGRVAVMYIGLGDRDNPTAGGAGMVFVDDIEYGRPAPEPEAVNVLANGGFEDGVMDPWSIYGDATGEVVADGPVEGSSCLHVTVNSAGANFWDAGLQHTGHVFEAGKSYTLSAFLKCSSGTLDINFKPELAADPWTGYGSQAFTMTEEWQEFSVSTGVLAEDVSPAAITFHIAYAAADFWIDDVRFYEDN